MGIAVEPLSDALGARITGIDLRRPIEEAAFETIHRAWLDHQVLVFPGQELGEEDQLRFTRLFGQPGGRNRKVAAAEEGRVSHPGIMLISNIREDGKPIGSLPDGEMMFHSDGAYAKRPFRYTLLYAIEIPSVGGNTLFANMYKAYEALPAELKRRLAGWHAEHRYYAGTVQKDRPTDSLTGVRTHPLFVAHEETGRTALYASRLLTTRIPELSADESAAVLEQLFDHAERPDFIYEHVWTPGDFVMWDNRCTNHARTDFPAGERRLLRRTTVLGVDPRPGGGSRLTPMADLTLRIASGPYDRIEALRYGGVKPEGITLDYETRIPVHGIFVGMAERAEFDVSEMSLALYLTKRGRNDFPFVAIPVFPSRVFRHGNFFINRRSGIRTPKELEGRRVGIQEYRQTAGIWMRGILRDEYGVDTESIEWVEGGVDAPRKPSASDVRPDRPVRLSALAGHDTLSAALAGGEIDAVIAARQPASSRTDPDVVRLIPDFRAAERDWFARTGIFPIMHTVVMREALYRDNPWIAQSLFAAFEASKAAAIERMRYTGAMMYMTPWLYDDLDEMDRVFGGDPWPYGLEANRAQLGTFMRHLVEEGFLPAPVALEDLFAPVI